MEQKSSERSECSEYRRETGPTGTGTSEELRSELVSWTGWHGFKRQEQGVEGWENEPRSVAWGTGMTQGMEVKDDETEMIDEAG